MRHDRKRAGLTQTEMVLGLLKARGSAGLTPLEALRHGCGMRLAARINDLRNAGHVIDTHNVVVDGATVARYVLRQTPTVAAPTRGEQEPMFR